MYGHTEHRVDLQLLGVSACLWQFTSLFWIPFTQTSNTLFESFLTVLCRSFTFLFHLTASDMVLNRTLSQWQLHYHITHVATRFSATQKTHKQLDILASICLWLSFLLHVTLNQALKINFNILPKERYSAATQIFALILAISMLLFFCLIDFILFNHWHMCGSDILHILHISYFIEYLNWQVIINCRFQDRCKNLSCQTIICLMTEVLDGGTTNECGYSLHSYMSPFFDRTIIYIVDSECQCGRLLLFKKFTIAVSHVSVSE